MSAAIIPLVTVAGTVVSGVLSYQQSQAAAQAAQMQAQMFQQQAQQQAQLTTLQLQQQELEARGAELELRDEANRKRRQARLLQEQAMAQMAGRGLIAQPWGSFGAILGDAEDELYRDLESNRMQRATRSAQALTSMAGTAQAGTAAQTTSLMQSQAALADAQAIQLGALQGATQSLVSAYQIMPSFS